MEEKECIPCGVWIKKGDVQDHFRKEHGIDNPMVEIDIGCVRVVYDGRFVEAHDVDADVVGSIQHPVVQILDDLLVKVISRGELDAIVDAKCEAAFARLDSEEMWGSDCETDEKDIDVLCKEMEMSDGEFDVPLVEEDTKIEPVVQCERVAEQSKKLGNIADYISGQKTFLRAVILSASGPRSVATHKARQGTFSNLTLCDDSGSSINFSVWSEFGQNNVAELSVGQVVQVRGAKVLSRQNSVHDKFDPEVSTVHKLKYVDGVTQIHRLDSQFFENLQKMMHTPYVGNGVQVSLLDIQRPEMLGNLVTVSAQVVEVIGKIKVAEKRVMTAVNITDGAVLAKVKVWEIQHQAVVSSWAVNQKVQLSGLIVEWDQYKGIHCLAASSKSVFLSM